MMNVYTIPSSYSFVDVLARGILNQTGDDPLSLAKMQIMLPTRRSCRALREAFLRLTNGKPLMLPRMTPLGDVDEEELSFNLFGMEEDFTLPPAIAPLHRQFLLSKLIAAQGHGRTIDQDLVLASALARLMDQIHTEDLSLIHLPNLVDEAALAEHWQVSVDFLKILSEHWPKILSELGMIDPADRRNRLLKKLNEFWRTSPPDFPVIAAGSTGSIPATSAFLKTIAQMPMGCVILPALDQRIDDESWNALDDTHPQGTLSHLLKSFGVERKDVKIWGGAKEISDKTILAREMMRPSETSDQWQSVKTRIAITPKDLNITRYDCETPQQEALVIALAMREALETPEKTAALVTPDRKLAQRVAMVCRRWGIEIDDSGGYALSNTRAGTFLRLCAGAAKNNFRPVSLLDFCKHALCNPKEAKAWRSMVRSFDITHCRGVFTGEGFDFYRQQETKNEIIPILETGFAPFYELIQSNAPKTFEQWITAHLAVAEFFCAPGILWAGHEGETASNFFVTLQEHANLLPSLTIDQYLDVLESIMKGVNVRTPYGLHPRLMILGQLEARMASADLMILSSLNEKSWPPDAGDDPWMSRPMRKKFGLPSLERSVGLSAHDFVQGFCAKEVILTRAARVEGTPTVPSRWLARMETVFSAMEIKLPQGNLLAIAQKIDETTDYKPFERPAPKPPLSLRPRKLSVTKIENWMKDPYGIYARYILKLKKLNPLEQKPDAALKGTILHDIMQTFVEENKKHMPDNAHQNFINIAKEKLKSYGMQGAITAFWIPRLSKAGTWFINHEKEWRKVFMPQKLETEGQKKFQRPGGEFILTAKADRVDISKDGTSAAIIDYKSGGNYSKVKMVDGRLPQLPLEMLILEDGGFTDVKAVPVSNLSYLILNGGDEGGKTYLIDQEKEISGARENAEEGLTNLIDLFDNPNTPYYAIPRPEFAPKSEYNDYEHLARVKEWTALDEAEEG